VQTHQPQTRRSGPGPGPVEDGELATSETPFLTALISPHDIVRLSRVLGSRGLDPASCQAEAIASTG
jgi:hypothetical protein